MAIVGLQLRRNGEILAKTEQAPLFEGLEFPVIARFISADGEQWDALASFASVPASRSDADPLDAFTTAELLDEVKRRVESAKTDYDD